MICCKCGAQAQEDAIYCSECGVRLDGKKACPICEKIVDDTSKFCAYCGARIDGKTKCEVCGTEHLGSFCPNCGNTIKKAAKKVHPTEKSCSLKSIFEDRKDRLFGIISGGIALFGAVCALIFIFFIGVNYTTNFDGGEISTDMNLFYFFGDAYNQIDTMIEGVYFHGLYGGTITFWSILGTIISVLSFVGVSIFAVIGGVRYFRYILGKGDKTGEKYSLFAILTLIAGAGTFFTLTKVLLLDKFSSIISISSDWNGATVAGQVLGALVLGGYVICKLLSYGKSLLTSDKLTGTITCIIGFAFLTVIFCVAKNIGLDVTTDITTGSFSFLRAIILFFPDLESGMDVKELNAMESRLMNTVFYSCIAQVLVLLLLVSLVISIYQQIKGIKEENSALIWSIVTTVISVLLMVISTVVSLAFKSTVKVSGQMAEVGISVSLAKQWITLIFAILYMVLCIIQKILKNNAKTKE